MRQSVSKLDKQLRDFWEKASHMVTRKSEVVVLFDIKTLEVSVVLVPEFHESLFRLLNNMRKFHRFFPWNSSFERILTHQPVLKLERQAIRKNMK